MILDEFVEINLSSNIIKHYKDLGYKIPMKYSVSKRKTVCDYSVKIKVRVSDLQRRAKKTEKDEKGRFRRKKRFGKSLANKAPAMLLTIIDRKLGYYGKVLNKIDTYSVKASQYNHIDRTYTKKKLSQRWNYFEDIKVQRDMYSAFLIMNVDNDLKGINQNKCNEKFENFLKLHDIEVKRLTGCKNLSSIAI